MKLEKIIVISLVLVMLCNCNDNQPEKANPSLNFLSTTSIPLDTETTTRQSVRFTVIDKTPYLSFFNDANYSLYIHNFETGDLVKKLAFEKEGPQGIDSGGNISVAHVLHNLDSIFLAGSSYQYLVDGTGKILNKGSLYGNTQNTIGVGSKTISFDDATYFKDGQLHTGITTYIDTDEAPFLKATLPLSLDTLTTQYVKQDEVIPNYKELLALKEKLRQERRYAAMGLDFELAGDLLYVTTPISDTVYVYQETQLAKRIYTGNHNVTVGSTSDFFDKFRNSTYRDAEKIPFYKELLIDKIRITLTATVSFLRVMREF